ncbi:hypothetical protein PpBr36_02287 [Pyricularia pennisetigena]|uniref:hypothetical protein n=1 Tax=Pyricularia pennisetigena TaxID=1578925 RepID=UPI0011524613|nr:hypothetical protein PpBr36_02287 [Pyricularia pennisetigena]TLS30176.1 hypothetical protein PpBr36_02287 [Pyricularia pennisetigena]
MSTFAILISETAAAGISITANNRLNKDVINYPSSKYSTVHIRIIRDDYKASDYQIEYISTFRIEFVRHGGKLLIIRRIFVKPFGRTPDKYASPPDGKELLVILCLGWCLNPIDKFLRYCCEFKDKQRKSFVTNIKKLDETLIRDGKAYKKVFFGYIDEDSARLIPKFRPSNNDEKSFSCQSARDFETQSWTVSKNGSVKDMVIFKI